MKTLVIDTRKKYKIFYDPLRQGILKTMKKIGRPCTVKDVSDTMEISHSKVHYHMRKLLEIGAVGLDHEEAMGNITAVYYDLDYESVNIMADPDEHITNAQLMDDMLDKLKKDSDENFMSLAQSYHETLRRLDSKEKVFGIHFFNDDIYLDFEERMELQKMVSDYVSSHSKKPDQMKGKTKTRVYMNMYDLEIHDK
ncbi:MULTISPECIES: helix-turn-helix domain-containing protein [unclassified Fusibacter]|uniref:winged helix-turn-helix domain-containing protein n=1 Tax=unclassified Fusibacter TaxID=2624464 RepID=UPI0010111E62|nr:MULTISPECIES: helix-turn-helix domain-containing protein [unclassified Fusibacter]MCK8060160.1 helix-turn-helix domain-containing protein [Fusibacter sp. A2]NPE22300.1 helix-turn-helix transcriptional regulator [Fusibacter sp. A1]RXV61073.1 ArsR family transcriptional regulator [Fusibacter sp. A1]